MFEKKFSDFLLVGQLMPMGSKSKKTPIPLSFLTVLLIVFFLFSFFFAQNALGQVSKGKNQQSKTVSGQSAQAAGPSEYSTIFRVQIGAYSLLDSATRKKRDLNKLGIDCAVYPERSFYKVQCGNLRSKSSANLLSKQIAEFGFTNPFVVKYRLKSRLLKSEKQLRDPASDTAPSNRSFSESSSRSLPWENVADEKSSTSVKLKQNPSVELKLVEAKTKKLLSKNEAIETNIKEPVEAPTVGPFKSDQGQGFFQTSKRYLITVAILVLLLTTTVFFLFVIAKRKWGSFQSFRAHRIVSKHLDNFQIRAEDADSLKQVANRLRDIGNPVIVEKIIDFGAERLGSKSFLRDLYDATKITDKYIHMLEKSKSWKKRVFSCEKLGRIGSGRAVPILLSTVRDITNEDEDVRLAALRSLGRIRDKRAIPFLIEALGSPETWLPPRIGEILVLIGAETIHPLTKELKNLKNESRRAWAAEILGSLGAESAANSLMESLLDASPEVRAKAAGALGKIKYEKAIIKLTELLISEPTPFVRTRVSQALGAMRNPMVVQYLINVLKDPEWWVRIRAVEALEQLGETSIPSLLIALEDEDREVCRRAAMALEKMGYIRKILQEYGKGAYKPELRKILFLAAKSGVVESLNEYLFNSESVFQKRIIRLLGEAQAQGAAEPLVQLLKNSSESTPKARIIESLGRIGAKESIPLLIEHLKDPEYWVRMSSAESLGLLNAVEFSDDIVKILEDPNPEARISALRALSMLKASRHKAEITKLIADPSPAVRANAFVVMRELNIKVITPAIMEILQESPEEVRIEAVKYFSSIKYSEALYDIVRILPYASDTLRKCIIEYIASIKPKRFQDILDQFTGVKLSNETIGSVVDIASLIGDKDAYQYVYDHSQRTNEYIREKAIRALIQFGFKKNRTILGGALFDPSAPVRIAVLTGIRLTDDPGFLEKALTLENDPNENVRLALVLAVSISGNIQLKPYVTNMLEDPHQRVVAGAFIGLAVLDSTLFLKEFYKVDNIKEIREEVQNISKDERFVDIINRIKEKSRSIKHIEISLLFEINEREFVAKLVNMAKESIDPQIRVKAMEMMKRIATPDYFTSILGIMSKDPHPQVREVAMGVIVLLGREEETISALSATLADPVPSVRNRAGELLGNYKNPKALEALFHVLETNDRDFRETITTSLSNILLDDIDTVRALVRSVPDKKTRKIGMAWLMGKTEKRESIPLLKNLLKDKEHEVRCAAIGALSKFQNKQLSKTMEDFVYDPNERVRAAAVNAIASTPTDSSYPTLLKAMDDIDEYVRLRAIIGLSKIDLKKTVSFLETKAYTFSEYRSYLNAVSYAAGITYDDAVKNNPKALVIISGLCDKSKMLHILKENANTKLRYHAFKVLSLFKDEEDYGGAFEIAIKDPDKKIRQAAEKQKGSMR